MLIALIISIALLFAAPLTGPVLNRRPGAWQAMDGFVVIVIIGILILNILPPVLESKMILAPLLFLAGLALPSIAEQVTHSHNTHRLVLGVPAIALIFHALGDGSILRLVAEQDEAITTSFGVLLHRFGLATAMWWLVRTNNGARSGWLFVYLMAAATLVGYFGANIAVTYTGETAGPLVQAFAAGSLLHVLFHPLDTDALNKGRGHGLHRLGSALGLLVVGGILSLHFIGLPATIDAGFGIHNHSQSDALSRLLHLGVGLSPGLLALATAAWWVKRLRFLAALSLVIWLGLFAIVPHNIFSYNEISAVFLGLYAFVMSIQFVGYGSRTVIGSLIGQSAHKHKH